MKRGSVWLANLGVYSGHVQGGVRPVIILGNWKALNYGSTITVVPITSKIKRLDMVTHVQGFNYKRQEPCIALCEQIITVSREFILKPIPDIVFNLFDIDKGVKEALGLEI